MRPQPASNHQTVTTMVLGLHDADLGRKMGSIMTRWIACLTALGLAAAGMLAVRRVVRFVRALDSQ